jgi:hypothetical protein
MEAEHYKPTCFKKRKMSIDEEQKNNFMVRYAGLKSRKAYKISSSISYNPH